MNCSRYEIELLDHNALEESIETQNQITKIGMGTYKIENLDLFFIYEIFGTTKNLVCGGFLVVYISARGSLVA